MPQTIEGVFIPEPNPENFWAFTVGQSRKLSLNPVFEITLIRLKRLSAEFRCSGAGQGVKGWLFLNETAILLRDQTGIPAVTATLRKTDKTHAYLQVTAPIKAMQMPVA